MALRVVARIALPSLRQTARLSSHSTFLSVSVLSTPPTFSHLQGKKNGLFATRMFSTSSSSSSSSSRPSVAAVADAQTIVERDHFLKIRRKIEGEQRKKISYAEFESICTGEGLTKEQALQLAQSLSDSGVILYLGNSSNAILRDNVFLKPDEFNKIVARILGELSDDTYLQNQVAHKQAELAQLKSEFEPLRQQREHLERKAHRTATTYIWLGFGYCIAQAVLVGRLTWWELSWDVMEPVTYMLTFATALIGYSYFVLTGSEYTYEGLRKTLQHRKLDKLIRRRKFDQPTYDRLQLSIAARQDEIRRIMEELRTDPVSLHLKDSKNPIV